MCDASLLTGRARRAFFESLPVRGVAGESPLYRHVPRGPRLDLFFLDLRSCRGPNGRNDGPAGGRPPDLMGGTRSAWLKAALAASAATWKAIVSDMPLGLVVRDGETALEGVANGLPGGPRGRELEIADLLRHCRAEGVKNLVVLTADVHYAASRSYHPDRAAPGSRDFDPF